MASPFRDDEETGNANAVRQGYVNATRVSPLTRKQHESVLGGYGLRIGWAKGQSDSAISREAARVVLDKFRADQERARAAREPVPASNQPAGEAPSPSYQGQPNAPGTPGGAPVGGNAGTAASTGGGPVSRMTSAGVSSGAMLPNTSVMRSGTLAGTSLPSLIRAPLQHLQAQSLLNQYGLPHERPPASALTDVATLLAWINGRKAEIQQVRNAQVQARPPTAYEPASVARTSTLATAPTPVYAPSPTVAPTVRNVSKATLAARAAAAAGTTRNVSAATIAARQKRPAPQQIQVGAKAAPLRVVAAPVRRATSARRPIIR